MPILSSSQSLLPSPSPPPPLLLAKPLFLFHFLDGNVCKWSHCYQKPGPHTRPCWVASAVRTSPVGITVLLLNPETRVCITVSRRRCSPSIAAAAQRINYSPISISPTRVSPGRSAEPRPRKERRNKRAQRGRREMSRDKADQCEAGGELPAAVCKRIIVLSGPVSLTWQMFQPCD